MKLLEIEKLKLNCYTFCDKLFKCTLIARMYCRWLSEPDHDMRITRLGYVPSAFNQDNIVVCSLNNFSLWVKLRANQNQGTPVSNSSPRLSFIAKLSL